MIAIKGTTMPKQCYDCMLISSDGLYCRATQKDVDWSNIHDDCPLIEIVRCKECKWCDNGIDEDGKPFLKCLGIHYGGTKAEDFCSYGERKTDDD